MTHKKLDAWKKSIDLTIKIYELTQDFPKDEIYGIVNQIRRSAVSVPSNIAEGCARQSAKETIQFLYISLGSIAELETQLLIADKLNYIKNSDEIIKDIVDIRKLIIGLIKFHKTKDK